MPVAMATMLGRTGALTLDSPLTDVMTPQHLKAATGMGIESVGDLLRHIPRTYFKRGEVVDFKALEVGQYVTLQATVSHVDHRQTRNRGMAMTVITVTDGSARINATFFNDKFLYKKFAPGQTVVVAGEVGVYRDQLQFTHPAFQLDEEADVRGLVGGMGCIYPASNKLESWNIASYVRASIERVDLDADAVPSDVRVRQGLVDFATALRLIHRPDDWAQVETARKRLRFDEAFGLQLALVQRRAETMAEPATPRPQFDGGLLSDFDRRLPFALTAGQTEVATEIFADLARSFPMHRLLQGDVGSGKTVVALRAMLAVVDSGGQAALLAPTEVLAQQHYRSISTMLGPLAEAGFLGGPDRATRVALLTGSQPAQIRRAQLLQAASGEAGIVIGTHALLEEHVQFAELGLVVVDEQHRFGVEQRDALRAKASQPPHLLVMTATPIPRTVAMTVFGDLEVSTLNGLPPGRSPISTTVVAVGEHPAWLGRVWERIREEVASGHRAFVVCPRIDAGDDDGSVLDAAGGDPDDLAEDRPAAAAVNQVFEDLRVGPLQGVRVGMLHGRLPADAKDQIMRNFANGELDVLVSTTVIEVGVDVPEATAMVVLDADRFGISQLHQLRGRVGRGDGGGVCLLVTTAPADSPGRERLDGVAATLDGFELAKFDLEQRREGDVLGVAQSGRRRSLKLLSLNRDEAVIVAARAEAIAIITDDPKLNQHPALARTVASLVGEQADYLVKA